MVDRSVLLLVHSLPNCLMQGSSLLKVVNTNCRTNNAYLCFTKEKKKIKSPRSLNITVPAALIDIKDHPSPPTHTHCGQYHLAMSQVKRVSLQLAWTPSVAELTCPSIFLLPWFSRLSSWTRDQWVFQEPARLPGHLTVETEQALATPLQWEVTTGGLQPLLRH